VEHAVTRSVRDSAALLDATSGPDLGDPYPAPAPARGFLAEAGADPGRLRVAFSGLPAGGHAADPECLEALDDAARLLEGLGHHVFERHLDVLTDEVGAAIGTIYSGFTAWVLEYWIAKLGRSPADDEIEPLTRLYWDLGKGVSAAQYLLARDVLFAFSRRVARLLADVDVWLTPTLAQPPLALGAIDAGVDPHLAMDRIGDFVAFPLIVANVTGAPAMSVPLHWTAGGLPVGVHFMARFGDEATLFRLASQLEAARPWAARRPSIGQD
jgi:amidase